MIGHRTNSSCTIKSLAISDPAELTFGLAPKPVTTRSGMVIGGGTVYPELNFTLPPMTIDAEHHAGGAAQLRADHRGRAAPRGGTGSARRGHRIRDAAADDRASGSGDWTSHNILLEGMQREKDRSGLKSVLRMTPNDNREFERPPLMRRGRYWDAMLELFEGSAAAGAELLSIESVGGKELHDEALVNGDLAASIFSLCILGERDMRFLWTHLQQIADKHGVKCAGDTACGFGNTAMVLAEQKMIPRVFAAVVRAVTAVRSLVAYECGAVGPGKDCGYENPILKAITGYPDGDGRQDLGLRAFESHGQSRRRVLRHLVQRVGAKHQAARRHGADLLHGTTRLRLPVDEYRPLARQGIRPAASTLVGGIRRGDRPAGVHHFARILGGIGAGHCRQRFALSRRCGRGAQGGGVAARRARPRQSCASRPTRLIWFDTLQDTLDELPESESEFIVQQLALADRSRFLPEEYGLKV